MNILVQKFGGTSVASEESREHVYKKIIEAVNEGYSLVVVVSAMGRTGDPYATDTLLNLIRNDYPFSNKRELDVMFSCGENISGSIIAANLQKRGYKSCYLTGEQAGIITDDNHLDARIIRVDNKKIKSMLEEGYIVVVGGSQGISESGEITTLGRGGSDTTGCALGVALDAFEIDIFTDVEGVMTADPRKVKNAVLLDEISYEDCCNMANKGAKVIHPRAVEVAMNKPQIKLYVKSTFSNHPGTLISKENEHKEKLSLTGIAGYENLVYGNVVSKDFTTIGKLQKIMQNSELADYQVYYGESGLVITCDIKNYMSVEKLFKDNGFGIDNSENVSEVSIVGSNIKKFPEFLEDVKSKLNDSGINIKMCLNDDRYVTFITSKKYFAQITNTLHDYVVNKDGKQLSFNFSGGKDEKV